MHDIKWIRDNPAAFDAGLKLRGLAPLAEQAIELDRSRRAAIAENEKTLATRNLLSKQIGIAKRNNQPAEELLQQAAGLDAALKAGEAAVAAADLAIRQLLEGVPNLPAEDVPQGSDESANVECRKFGEPRKFNFEPRDHVALGEGLGLMDFAAAAKLSGARFVVLKGALARLERSLAQFMLDLHTESHGYTEVDPPLLVKDSALYGTGNLPKYKDDLFKVTFTDHEKPRRIIVSEVPQKRDAAFIENFIPKATSEVSSLINEAARRKESVDTAQLENILRSNTASSSASASVVVYDLIARAFDEQETRWLIPTAEVSLTNLVADEIVDGASLPLRYTAWTPCFRSEAGAAGRDTRGMIRQHQFPKVEMVSIAAPEQSDQEHERMTRAAETVLEKLNLPYRRVLLCSGDMGFSARKTFDLEVWLPGQNAYREISSCSNCGDFQARRMNARFRKAGEKGTTFVHTLNGSGVAVGRALVAVLENYQQEDGSVLVPEALKPYMGGLDRIDPPAPKGKQK